MRNQSAPKAGKAGKGSLAEAIGTITGNATAKVQGQRDQRDAQDHANGPKEKEAKRPSRD